MQKVPFSKNIDLPKLEHCRKTIISHNVWDEHAQRGRLEWAWLGDDDLPFQKALTDPKVITDLTEDMLNEGRFVFSYMGLNNPDRVRIGIEKFEIRRRFLGGVVHGYRASMSLPDVSDTVGYLVSKSLSDLNTKLYGMCVQRLDTKFLEDKDSVNIMSGW